MRLMVLEAIRILEAAQADREVIRLDRGEAVLPTQQVEKRNTWITRIVAVESGSRLYEKLFGRR